MARRACCRSIIYSSLPEGPPLSALRDTAEMVETLRAEISAFQGRGGGIYRRPFCTGAFPGDELPGFMPCWRYIPPPRPALRRCRS